MSQRSGRILVAGDQTVVGDRDPQSKRVVALENVVKRFPVGDSEITVLKEITIDVRYCAGRSGGDGKLRAGVRAWRMARGD